VICPTPRETILSALQARLATLPAMAMRGKVLPERIPSAGFLILRDGEPGEPEVTLSPLHYHCQHRVKVEAVVQGTDRDSAFDALCQHRRGARRRPQQFGGGGGRHAKCATEREHRAQIPADDGAGERAELAAETAEQVPDLPALVGSGPVQPRRAVRARVLAGIAVALDPAEGPFGKGAEAFFSCSSSRPLGT
jgi:hypothetical protein